MASDPAAELLELLREQSHRAALMAAAEADERAEALAELAKESAAAAARLHRMMVE